MTGGVRSQNDFEAAVIMSGELAAEKKMMMIFTRLSGINQECGIVFLILVKRLVKKEDCS